MEFLKSKPKRSRSARKQSDADQGKQLLKKYKNFVRKLGRSPESEGSDNQWRGATDFTKLSNLDDTRDERDRSTSKRSQKKIRKSRSNHKKSAAETR